MERTVGRIVKDPPRWELLYKARRNPRITPSDIDAMLSIRARDGEDYYLWFEGKHPDEEMYFGQRWMLERLALLPRSTVIIGFGTPPHDYQDFEVFVGGTWVKMVMALEDFIDAWEANVP